MAEKVEFSSKFISVDWRNGKKNIIGQVRLLFPKKEEGKLRGMAGPLDENNQDNPEEFQSIVFYIG